jgi:cellobiose phosphorylase
VETIRAVLMNPGNKENAGVFQHPQGWAVMAETTLGRGDRAFEYLKHYVPAYQNDQAEIREVEPYVLCQSTYSTYSAKPGRSRVSWLTGAATWTYVALTQHVLGVRPDYDGLRVQPCVPRHWKQCAVARVFRGGTYRIAVQNPDGVCTGVRSVSVGGESLDPAAALPVIGAGETVDVQVVLGAG